MPENLKFLIVDDSPIFSGHIRAMVERLGHTVAGVSAAGETAVHDYRACRPDIVTMDINMPGMDGVEATRRILSEFPEAAVVVITSYGQEGLILQALEAGARGYLMKPLRIERLAELIGKVRGR